MPYREPGREQILVRWWPPIRDLIRDIGSTVLGLWILYHEEVVARHGDAAKIAAGLALLGAGVGVGIAERLLKKGNDAHRS